MVIPQQLVKEVDGLIADKALVLRVDKAVPRLLLEAAENVVVLGVELYLIAIQVVKQVIGAQNLGNLDELIGVTVAVEEGLLAENHGGKHGTETPHIQAVVILLEVDEQLRALEIARGNTDVVLSAGVIKFSQTPVNKAQLRENVSVGCACDGAQEAQE